MLSTLFSGVLETRKFCGDEQSNKNFMTAIDAEAIIHKKSLLQIARDGLPRPILGQHELGGWFLHFTTPECRLFDADFKAILAEIAPAWFPEAVIMLPG